MIANKATATMINSITIASGGCDPLRSINFIVKATKRLANKPPTIPAAMPAEKYLF